MSGMHNTLQQALRLLRLSPKQTVREPDAELSFERTLTDNALRMLATPAVPDDLALRLRLALSHEQVRANRRLLGRVRHAVGSFVEQRLRPLALHASVAGAAVALVCGTLLLGTVAPQQTVRADEEPLAGFSAPRFLYSTAEQRPVGTVDDAPLMVEAKVDERGRVYDYRVLSGLLDPAASDALQQQMLNGVFQPAQVFSQPVRGRVVLTFADVVVRG